MIFPAVIRIPINSWDRSTKIFLGVLVLVLVLVLIIFICLLARLNIFTRSNAYLEGFTFTNKLILPKNEAMQILQKGIINKEAFNGIIWGQLDKFSKYGLVDIDNAVEYEIPKILHFIWIGSQLPEKYIENINTYIVNNPSYEIWIWHDENTHLDKINNLQISSCKMQNINQIKFANAYGIDKMTNWAGKADIIRYEIIYNYGGMYIDVDSRSVKAFDNNFANSFICIETEGKYNNIQNAQFGFSRKNPFLRFVIECLQENIMHHVNQNGKLDDILSICGPPFFTTCFYWWMKQFENYPIKFINQAYTILHNEFSYNYHTMDKNW